MQLLDDEDLGTMMEIWWPTGSENPQPVELFSELEDLEPVVNVSPVSDDIDDEGLEEVEDVYAPSFSNPSCGIILRNEPGGDMLNVDPNATHAPEFPESKGLVAAIRQSEVPWRSVYCIRHTAVNFHNQYKNKDWCKRIVNMGYELEAHRFRHKLARLETNMAGSNPPLRQWLGSMEPCQWVQCFDEGVYGRRSGIPPRSYGVDLRNRRCEYGMFQTLRYPCAHVVAACATYSLNAEQYIDDVYTLERTLCIWGNEFLVLRDYQHWKCNRLCSRCCQIGHYVGESKVDQQQRGSRTTWI
ncbi:hypothetical protein GOBAR_AA18476 [Gossypium barbadense]|uniref:SWIM-type domain-containing protein n=1 Tax=Gossypium barbadense TaxID=3634 RepID=A0A2P5XFT8_GOSBA|nr:hypothetical protein GOBAR_AA18476 [Gossypium barbadense]